MISEKHSFDSCFEVFLADTPESKLIHYNLRYQVYCDEMGFEDKDKFPDQMEIDDWDSQSAHFMVRHTHTGQWLGALRLVSQVSSAFPFETKCVPTTPITPDQYQHSMELSRLCVLREARRFAPRSFAEQASDETSNIRYLSTLRNQNRSIMWGLIRAAVVYSSQNDITQMYFLVAPALALAVKKEGFAMRQVAEACDHRGQRIPYSLDVADVLANSLWETDYRFEYRRYSEMDESNVDKRQRA